MGQTIREITAGIEARIKPTLTGRDQHLGFCTALEHVNKDLGPDTIVGPALDVVVPLAVRVCPDCGVALVKRKATLASGDLKTAWICECDPESIPESGPPSSTTDPTPTLGNESDAEEL